jgi:hypothetical protein
MTRCNQSFGQSYLQLQALFMEFKAASMLTSPRLKPVAFVPHKAPVFFSSCSHSPSSPKSVNLALSGGCDTPLGTRQLSVLPSPRHPSRPQVGRVGGIPTGLGVCCRQKEELSLQGKGSHIVQSWVDLPSFLFRFSSREDISCRKRATIGRRPGGEVLPRGTHEVRPGRGL